MECPYARKWPDLKYRSKMTWKCLYYPSAGKQPLERELKAPCEIEKIDGTWRCAQNSELEVKLEGSRIL